MKSLSLLPMEWYLVQHTGNFTSTFTFSQHLRLHSTLQLRFLIPLFVLSPPKVTHSSLRFFSSHSIPLLPILCLSRFPPLSFIFVSYDLRERHARDLIPCSVSCVTSTLKMEAIRSSEMSQTFPTTIGRRRQKVNGKVVPVLLLTEHHAMKAYWGVGVHLHVFFDLGTRWR
jgi:hypothetical protein